MMASYAGSFTSLSLFMPYSTCMGTLQQKIWNIQFPFFLAISPCADFFSILYFKILRQRSYQGTCKVRGRSLAVDALKQLHSILCSIRKRSAALWHWQQIVKFTAKEAASAKLFLIHGAALFLEMRNEERWIVSIFIACSWLAPEEWEGTVSIWSEVIHAAARKCGTGTSHYYSWDVPYLSCNIIFSCNY